MTLTYSKNGIEIKTKESNDDVTVTEVVEGPLHTVTVTAKNDITLISYKQSSHWAMNANDTKFWNGYQSWTDTREIKGNFVERDVRNIFGPALKFWKFDRYGDSHIYDYSKNKLHGYDFFYAFGDGCRISYSLNAENAFLIYSYNKEKNSLVLYSDVEGKSLKKGESFQVLKYKTFTTIYEAKKAFEEDFPKKDLAKIFGYTSWYNYYQNISEDIILRDLEGLDERFNLFQIDDGYETFVGDWLEVDGNKFPNGLEPILEAIKKKGYRAGIWLAPLVAERKSRLFIEHPEYFKKDEDGSYCSCGSNWSGFYALDLENEEVWKYIEKCLTYYKDMGFSFFKLDFLYAASRAEYKGKTRAEMASYAYKRLRNILGDSIILGCGATIGQAANVFDYLRIGPDISLSFDDVWYMRKMHRERISTKVTLQNTIFRHFMNKRLFGNDPDVFLLRDDNIKLSKAQKEAIIIIDAIYGQLLMNSDNLSEYDEEKKELLNRALDIFYHAQDRSHKVDGDIIEITYKLNGRAEKFLYSTSKGVFVNGR